MPESPHVSPANPIPGGEPQLTIFDLGKHKPKQVKQLRRGEGKLLNVIRDSLAELHASGVDINGPVVFVCEKKSKSRAAALF